MNRGRKRDEWGKEERTDEGRRRDGWRMKRGWIEDEEGMDRG